MAVAEVETQEDQRSHILNRQVRIALHPNAKTKELTLPWYTGRPSKNTPGHKSERTIKKNAKTAQTVPVQQAWGWFGYFTVLHDMENEPDEAKRSELQALYDLGKKLTLQYYDYLRPTKIEDGTMPIGPHRLPDVVLTVIEDDGTEWEPIRLHEMYGVGDFDKMQFPEPVDPRKEKLEEQTALGVAIASELAKIGMIPAGAK